MSGPTELLKGTTPGPFRVVQHVPVVWRGETPIQFEDQVQTADGSLVDPIVLLQMYETARDELAGARAEIERVRKALWYACDASNVRYLIALRWARDHPDAFEGRHALPARSNGGGQ